MKIKYDRFYYNPLPDELMLGLSRTHGHGVFAKCDLPRKYDLGMSHIKIPIIHGYVRTPMGGFINHSEEPNAKLVEVQRIKYLYFLRDIKQGEEITLKYTLYDPTNRDNA